MLLELELEPAQGSPRTSYGNADSGSAGAGWGLRICISKEFPPEETEEQRSEGEGNGLMGVGVNTTASTENTTASTEMAK